MTQIEQSQSVTFNSGTFKFSGASLNTLESSEYSLCSIVLDRSYSIQPWAKELEKAVKEVISSCQKSPRADNLLIRLSTFAHTVEEFHGWKELNKCNPNDYNGILNHLGHTTSLYDGVAAAVEATSIYGKELFDSDYTCNALTVILTDGDNNSSSETVNSLKKRLAKIVGEKKLESHIGILVGVNTGDSGINLLLNNFAKECGLEYLDIAHADAKSIAKLAQFISKSISSVSSHLGTGTTGPSLSF
jgi:hypothetical protein